MSRLHAAHVVAIAHGDELRAPRPGVWIAEVARGEVVRGGARIGQLVVLGQSFDVIAPEGRAGVVTTEAQGPRAVAYGDALVATDPDAHLASSDAGAATTAAQAATGLVFRAPTSGRFYTRSAPDKPPFVEVGTVLAPGATICLLEVMKTFHRVTYAGQGLPERARVVKVLVADGADVNAADPLLALE